MADRMGRKAPLMISILWYLIRNFIAGFSPGFAFLFFWRALLGTGLGPGWPAGAALAMASWSARSRGFISGILQGSWGLGFALPSIAYGFLYAPFEAMGKGYGLAWPADSWRATGTCLRLDPFLCEGTGSLGGQPEAAGGNRPACHAAVVSHLQERLSVEHDHRLRLDGGEFMRLLLDLGAVQYLLAKRTRLVATDGRHAVVLGQHSGIRGLQFLERGSG
ncbi:MAG: MFS transporter [Acetobacteraceae bacterium]|nr:MFS transporter [Acetobacteraceae bacterium]